MRTPTLYGNDKDWGDEAESGTVGRLKEKCSN